MTKRYQRGSQNQYIKEEQTTQWPKEKVQTIQALETPWFILSVKS
jgi:hypothetical protein